MLQSKSSRLGSYSARATMRGSLLCALCALGAAVPAPIKDTVLTITPPSADRAHDHADGPTHGGATGANATDPEAPPETLTAKSEAGAAASPETHDATQAGATASASLIDAAAPGSGGASFVSVSPDGKVAALEEKMATLEAKLLAANVALEEKVATLQAKLLAAKTEPPEEAAPLSTTTAPSRSLAALVPEFDGRQEGRRRRDTSAGEERDVAPERESTSGRVHAEGDPQARRHADRHERVPRHGGAHETERAGGSRCPALAAAGHGERHHVEHYRAEER